MALLAWGGPGPAPQWDGALSCLLYKLMTLWWVKRKAGLDGTPALWADFDLLRFASKHVGFLCP